LCEIDREIVDLVFTSSKTMLAKLTNVLLIVLSLTLGFFFMFVGILKLTPAVKEDIHEEMVSFDFGCKDILRSTDDTCWPEYRAVFHCHFFVHIYLHI